MDISDAVDITINLLPQSQLDQSSINSPDDLIFIVTLPLGGGKILTKREPAINFIKEYYSALVYARLLNIRGICSLFSDDILIEMSSSSQPEMMVVTIRVAGEIATSSIVRIEVLGEILKTSIVKIISVLRSRFSYEEISQALSMSMIPLNEGYLATFLD